MEINIHQVSGNQFVNYSDTSVTIKDHVYSDNIIVTNKKIELFKSNINIHGLKPEDLGELLLTENTPDLIIFGSANKIEYPNSHLLSILQQKRIGFEVMSIQALCRTFNFLISEERKIAAILIFHTT